MTENREVARGEAVDSLSKVDRMSSSESRVQQASLKTQQEFLKNQGKLIDLAREVIGGIRDLQNHQAVLAKLESEKQKIGMEIQKLLVRRGESEEKGKIDLMKIEMYRNQVESMIMEYIPVLTRELGIPEGQRAEVVSQMMAKLPQIQINA